MPKVLLNGLAYVMAVSWFSTEQELKAILRLPVTNFKFLSSQWIHPPNQAVKLIRTWVNCLNISIWCHPNGRPGMSDMRSVGNPCNSGVAAGGQVRFFRASQMMLNTCVKATERRFLPPSSLLLDPFCTSQLLQKLHGKSCNWDSEELCIHFAEV